MRKKVLLFGWDGVPPNIIEEALKKGYLPYFHRFMNDGVYGTIDAVLPIATPSNWFSAFTGVYPDKHGVIYFTSIDRNYNMVYMNLKHLKVPPIWEYLKIYNKRGIYVNIPLSSPAPKVNGIWISSEEFYTKPSKRHVYPENILEILRKYGYMIGYPSPLDYPRKIIDKVLEAENKKLEVFHRLLQDYEWDIAIFIARSPDMFLHIFMDIPNYHEAILKCLHTLDNWFGKFMDEFGNDTNFIIFSDHGNKRKKGLINLIKILRDFGYLEVNKGRRLKARWLRKNKITRTLWSRLPPTIKEVINKQILNRYFELGTQARMINSLINWRDTLVFPNIYVGGLKINLRRNFIHGRVDESSSKQLLDDLVTRLNAIEHNGVKVFKEVLTTSGNDTYISDVFLEPNDDLWFTISRDDRYVIPINPPDINDDKKMDIDKYKAAYHIREGFYLIVADAVKSGSGPKLNMTDITPITLYLMDIPIPRGLDGSLKIEMFNKSYLDKNKPKYRQYYLHTLKRRISIVKHKLSKK